jgi:hypothetical protein
MIRLEQAKNFRSATTMAIEIEVLPLETPEHRYVRLLVKYMIDARPVLEMESSIRTNEADLPLVWLKKAVHSRRKELSATFGNPVSSEHLILINQSRYSEADFAQIQKELGEEAFPYPFSYALDVLINPDPEGLLYAGIGMHFSAVSYIQIIHFFEKIRDAVNAAFGNAGESPK